MAANRLDALAHSGRRARQGLPRLGWGRLHAALLLTTALLVAGCIVSEGRVEDTMTIHNRTDAPIEVRYEAVTNGQVYGVSVIQLDRSEQSLVGPQIFGGDRCLRGEFVARSGDKVVGRLPQPCKQQVWEVTE